MIRGFHDFSQQVCNHEVSFGCHLGSGQLLTILRLLLAPLSLGYISKRINHGRTVARVRPKKFNVDISRYQQSAFRNA
jgi:hypothetical protein